MTMYLPGFALSQPFQLVRRGASNWNTQKLTFPKTKFVTMSSTSGSRRILVPIANGSEEIETSSAVDTFRRAGAEVTMASVEDSLTVTMSRGMKFVADESINSVKGPFDAVALPGNVSFFDLCLIPFFKIF